MTRDPADGQRRSRALLPKSQSQVLPPTSVAQLQVLALNPSRRWGVTLFERRKRVTRPSEVHTVTGGSSAQHATTLRVLW